MLSTLDNNPKLDDGATSVTLDSLSVAYVLAKTVKTRAIDA